MLNKKYKLNLYRFCFVFIVRYVIRYTICSTCGEISFHAKNHLQLLWTMGFDVWSSKIFFFPRYWRRESNYYGKEIYEKEIEIIRQNTTATYIRAHHHLIYRLTYDYVFTSSPVARRMSKRKKSPKSEFVSWRLKQSIYYKYKRFRFQPYELMSVMLQYVRLPNLPFDGLRSVVRFTFFRNLGSYGWMYFDFVVASFFPSSS